MRVNMACCCSPRVQSEEKNDYILDVEEILNDHIWNKFKTSRPSWQKLCLRRKDFIVEVPMNYFHFEKFRKDDVRPRARIPHGAPLSSQRPPTLQQDPNTHAQGRDVMPDHGHMMALSTDFINSTGSEQTYSFKFEKTRKASVSVTVQKGFSIGTKVNFSLGLPSSGKVSGETDMRISVSKATGDVIEETVTWSANNDIKVNKNSNCTARVFLTEVPVSFNFKVWTKMSMPSGGAPGTVKPKKGGDWTFVHVINNLKPVFKEYKHVVDFHPEPLGDEEVTYSVVFRTTGIVEGVRLSGQKILLDENPIVRRSSQVFPPSQGPPQGSAQNNHIGGLMTEDGYFGSTVPHHGGGRMIALPQPPPPSHPIITEMPEEDGGVMVVGGSDHVPSIPAVRAQGGSGVQMIPRITTTSPSSLASSPLSEAGSPDISEGSSKKAQTVTTV